MTSVNLPSDSAGNTVTAPETQTDAVAAPSKKSQHEVLYFALRSKKFIFAVAVLGFLVLLAIFGPIIDSNDPLAQTLGVNTPPSTDPGYWFGTTTFGEDVFAQFVNGLRATFFVGLLGGSIASLIGMSIGFIAGYKGGWVDELLNMVTNVFLVIPTLALLLVISSYLQRSWPEARGVFFESIFVGVTAWPWAARAIRAQTFSLRSRDFIDLAKLSGRRGLKIIVFEIAPNMSSYLMLTFILLFGNAILIAASLDFIGLGPTSGMSLGLMMFNAVSWAALLLGTWWWFVPPGLGIMATVGALYVMNVGLDEIFNPKLREL